MIVKRGARSIAHTSCCFCPLSLYFISFFLESGASRAMIPGLAPTKMSTPHPIHLFDALFTTDDMREIFSDHRRLQSMLNFEAALARALQRAGIAPKETVAAIESQCDANLFSIEKLAREAALAGNVAIPMVKQLTSLVAKSDE